MHKLAFGQAGMGETISAEGGQYPLADYVRGGQNLLRHRIKQVEAYRQFDFWGPQSPALLHNSVHAEYIMHCQLIKCFPTV